MKHNWKRNSSPLTLFISPHLNIPHRNFFNRKNFNFIIAKRKSSSYNKFFTNLIGKKPLLYLILLYLYKKEKTFGFPTNDPWASPMLHLPQFSHIKCLYNLKYITIKQTNKALRWRAPLDCSRTSSMLKLLRQCFRTQKVRENEYWFQI